MTTEAKAQELIMKVHNERGTSTFGNPIHRTVASHEALCRAIEQHEAFRQEVSDALHVWYDGTYPPVLDRFIIPAPKTDPLLAAMNEVIKTADVVQANADQLRTALDALGFEIREKSDD